MTKSATKQPVATIGLDIAKNSFSVHGFDCDGNTIVTKELRIKVTVHKISGYIHLHLTKNPPAVA